MTVRFRNIVRALIPLGMAGFVLLGSTPSAHALLTLTAQETAGPLFSVFDNQAGVDLDPAIGTILLANNTVFGDFLVNGSLSTSNSPGGALAQLISSSLSVTNTTGASHSVVLKISDTGFAQPSPATFNATASGTFNVVSPATSVLGSTANALAYVDFTNTLFGTQHTIQNFSFNAANLTTDSYANTVANVSAGPQSTPYSMTVQLNYTLAGHNVLSSRNDSITATAVPEPATLAMVLAGLPLAGFVAWRRRRKSV